MKHESSYQKGDVILVSMIKVMDERYAEKRRPAVVVSDESTGEIVIVPLTSDLKSAQDNQACILVEMRSEEGQAAGLRIDSVIDCRVVANVPRALIVNKIGNFTKVTMDKVDAQIRGSGDN